MQRGSIPRQGTHPVTDRGMAPNEKKGEAMTIADPKTEVVCEHEMVARVAVFDRNGAATYRSEDDWTSYVEGPLSNYLGTAVRNGRGVTWRGSTGDGLYLIWNGQTLIDSANWYTQLLSECEASHPVGCECSCCDPHGR